MRTRTLLCTLVLIAWGCATAVITDPAVLDAGAEARKLAQTALGGFEIVKEQPVAAGEETRPLKAKLETGSCYRIVALRADAPDPEQVTLSFSHSEQVVEKEVDFVELTRKDGELRRQRVVWGVCAWPLLEGELTVYHNLADTGGHMLLLRAEAAQLSWKAGKDVRLYLQGMGIVDLEAQEQQEAQARLETVFSEHHSMLPPLLFESYPTYSETVGTTKRGWTQTIGLASKTCYHLFLASLNCRIEYEVVNAKTGALIHDDATPSGVGRLGWSHDFCPEKKHAGKQAQLRVRLTGDTDEYEKCWFTTAVYDYEASPKEMKQVKAQVKQERKQVQALVDECLLTRSSCEKACEKAGAGEFTSECTSAFSECTESIMFEGQRP
jgi:hypothetical protein